MAGSLLFVLASPAYALAAGAAGLTAVRLLHGAGMGLFPTAASAVVTDLAPPDRRGQMLGLYGATASVAMAVGPVTGVALVQRWGFAPLFALSGLIAVAGWRGRWPSATHCASAAPSPSTRGRCWSARPSSPVSWCCA